MIPSNTFTSPPVVSNFIPPYNEPYHLLSQNVMGGIALNNPSQGRQVKVWNVAYDGVNINVKPGDGPIEFSLAVADVVTVSLAFDNNMAIVLAWTTAIGAFLYYFDTIASGYITKSYPNVTSCRICVDDADDFYNAQSDVIFAYTLAGALYYRQQRDRYDIERFIGVTLNTLIRMAPNVGNRLQFQLLSIQGNVTFLVYDTFTGTGLLSTHIGEIGTPWSGGPVTYELSTGTVCPVGMQLGDPVYADGSSSFLNGYVEVSFRFN